MKIALFFVMLTVISSLIAMDSGRGHRSRNYTHSSLMRADPFERRKTVTLNDAYWDVESDSWATQTQNRAERTISLTRGSVSVMGQPMFRHSLTLTGNGLDQRSVTNPGHQRSNSTAHVTRGRKDGSEHDDDDADVQPSSSIMPTLFGGAVIGGVVLGVVGILYKKGFFGSRR